MVRTIQPKFIVRVSVVTLVLIAIIGWYLLFSHNPDGRLRHELALSASEPERLDNPPVSEQPPIPEEPEHRAYVFYATADAYACSALVNAHRIRNVVQSTLPIYLIAGPGLSASAISSLKSSTINITVIHDTAPPLGKNGVEYYAEVLLKLRALQLHRVNPDLKRIIVLDSDQLVRKNLDHLFNLPPVDVAAPLMYWGGGMAVTTTLMVASLSEELWEIIDGALHHMRQDEYDMDLVNRVLQKRLMVLPGRYCTLNSHWEVMDTPGWFRGTKTMPNATSEQLEALYEEVEVLHFTAMGKPWGLDPDTIVQDRKFDEKSEVHPLFIEQFREWRDNAREVCNWELKEPPAPSATPKIEPPAGLSKTPTPEPPAESPEQAAPEPLTESPLPATPEPPSDPPPSVTPKPPSDVLLPTTPKSPTEPAAISPTTPPADAHNP